MKIHKNTRLLPKQRQEIFDTYHNGNIQVTDLAKRYRVSRVTIYKVLREVRTGQVFQRKSTNVQYRTLSYGIRRLAKIEERIQEKLKTQARRYNKSYPGEMVHVDGKRLPLLTGESRKTHPYEYMYVGIDDYSRELYAVILPDKRGVTAARFMRRVIDECPYTIECIYSDNGKEFKGIPKHHAFMVVCEEAGINQKYTKVGRPQTNGKAERVIRTLMDMWHRKEEITQQVY
jgi:transposase InsO family protein